MITAVTGGIGAGKSTVCEVLRIKGFDVYDCDSRAKHIMNIDAALRSALRERFGRDIIGDTAIDRKALAAIVFNDSKALADLNTLVHSAVKDDIMRAAGACRHELFFVETAILYQSGLNGLVDAEWRVEADEATRIRRVMRRNGMTEAEVRARINAQRFEIPAGARRPRLSIIDNSDNAVVLPQINALIFA